MFIKIQLYAWKVANKRLIIILIIDDFLASCIKHRITKVLWIGAAALQSLVNEAIMREINDKNQFIMPHKKRDSFKEIQMRLKINKKRLRIFL